MCKRVSIRPGVVSADIFSFLIFYEVSLSVHKGELLSVGHTQFTGAANDVYIICQNILIQ